MDVRQANPNLFKIGQKYQSVYVKAQLSFFIISGDINLHKEYRCTAHCWLWPVTQQYIENASLPFSYNIGYMKEPKCYVIPLFPIFLMIHYNNIRTVCITCVKTHTDRFCSVTSDYLSSVAKNLNISAVVRTSKGYIKHWWLLHNLIWIPGYLIALLSWWSVITKDLEWRSFLSGF